MATMTLTAYQRAEHDLTMRESRMALGVHAAVTGLIWVAVFVLNVFVATGFPWSIFVVAGTGIGLFFHWFGYRRAEADLRRHQEKVEALAETILAGAA